MKSIDTKLVWLGVIVLCSTFWYYAFKVIKHIVN